MDSLHTLACVGLWFVLGMGCPKRLHKVRSRTHEAVTGLSMLCLDWRCRCRIKDTQGLLTHRRHTNMLCDSKSRTLRNSELTRAGR